MNREQIYQIAQECKKLPIYPDPRFPPSLYYRFLRNLAIHMQPKLSVELGVCGGGGSLHLAAGWPLGKVFGVDFADDHRENINHILAKCPNFHFLIDDSVHAADFISQEEHPIDILFVDTVHERQRTWDEFNAYKPILADEAVVCFDDLFRPGMGQFWSELEANKMRLDFLHTGAENGGGFGVWWK